MNVGMVFAIIFTAIVIMFFLVFGSDVIQSFTCMSSDAQVQRTLKSVEDLTEETYDLAQGSSRTLEVKIPSGSKICFVRPSDPGPNPEEGWEPDPIYQSLIEEQGLNVWYQQCSGENGGKIEHLRPAENFCIQGGGEVYLENRGMYIEISPGGGR